MRAKPAAPVAAPLHWDELEDRRLSPQRWTIASIGKRLDSDGDPWRRIGSQAASLRGANLSLARFSGANLKDTDFTDSNWWKSRGLNSDQITWLKKNFAPGEKASAAVRDDYEHWLKELEPGE